MLEASVRVDRIKGKRCNLQSTLARKTVHPRTWRKSCKSKFRAEKIEDVSVSGVSEIPASLAAACRAQFWTRVSIEELHSPKAPATSGVI